MKTITGLLRLYRIDSFLLTVSSFYVTLIITQGNISEPKNVVLGLLLGVVFVNFIYSINSYFDADIDSINKPHRPIPSKAISKFQAGIYIALLGILSLIMPLFFIEQKILLLALYAFPIVGVLYSNPFYPLKKNAIAAPLLTTIILTLPAFIAVLCNNNPQKYFSYVIIIFFYCLCMVPLKDIEDVEGDAQFNSDNWATIYGEKRLVLTSLAGLFIVSAAAFVFRNIPGFILLSAVFLCAAIVEIIFITKKLALNKLYKALILTNLVMLFAGIMAYITVIIFQ